MTSLKPLLLSLAPPTLQQKGWLNSIRIMSGNALAFPGRLYLTEEHNLPLPLLLNCVASSRFPRLCQLPTTLKQMARQNISIRNWSNSYVPTPHSVKLTGWTTYLLLNLLTIPTLIPPLTLPLSLSSWATTLPPSLYPSSPLQTPSSLTILTSYLPFVLIWS